MTDGPKVRVCDLPKLFATMPHLEDEDAAAFEADIIEARAALNTPPRGPTPTSRAG